MFLVPRDNSSSNCLTCPSVPPSCSSNSCPQDKSCAVTSQVCNSCPRIYCVPKAAPGSASSGGTSKAALAGAVVGALIFLAAVLAAVWFLQRRVKAKRVAKEKALEPPPEVPASAADVLRREDPHEKSQTSPIPNSNHTRVYDGQSLTTINLDPNSPHADNTQHSISRSELQSSLRNPFGDQSTLGSNRTEESHQNEIQIALVPYGSVQPPSPPSPGLPNSPTSAKSNTPSRPPRSPDVNLRLDNSSSPFDLSHVNVSDDSFPKSGLPASVRSGMSTGSRASYLSTGTYATDFVNGESSTVVIRQQGKILGLSRAQVVTAPVGTPSASGTPTMLSPVASSHLMPIDRRVSRATNGRSPLAQSSFTPDDIPEEQFASSPFADKHATRVTPTLSDTRSVRTTASGWNDTDSIASGIEASISSAKRVIIRSDGRLTSPLSSPTLASPSQDRTYSANRLSFASEASSRADSILEAFPFVPPSLPSSPQSIQTFRSQLSNRTRPPRSPLASSPSGEMTDDEELVPPDRRGLGVSVYSAKSSASSGLGDYPVELHLDSSTNDGRSPLPSRASLDTLALSRDLSAFPISFDGKTPTRDSFQHPPKDSN